MKKLLTVLVLLGLVFSFQVSIAMAQDPVEEEVSEEPTEEVVAGEPTEEVVEGPVEEIVSEEPVIEEAPTDGPVSEPVEEVEVEEEEPVEAVSEPTATPEPTLVPTDAEIGDSAVPGNWNTDYIGVQNLGTGAASVSLDLYQGGTSQQKIDRTIANAKGGALITSSDITNNGQYAGVLSSDQPIAAAVINTNNTGQVGDTYLATADPATTQILPMIFRGHSEWYSTFYIQNASSAQQTVTVKAYKTGSTTSVNYSYVVAANSSVEVDFMGSDFNAFGSGQNAYGYAVVEGTSPIAVVCSNVTDAPGAMVQMMYRGVSTSDAGTDLRSPLVFNGYSSWGSGVNVVNIGASATTVTLTFSPSGGGTYTSNLTLQPNESQAFQLYQLGFPTAYGGATMTTTGGNNVVAVVNSVTYDNPAGAVGFQAAGLNPSSATTKVAVPLGFKTGEGGAGLNDWNTGISVYSVGAGGNIRTTWVDATSGTSLSYDQTGVANGIVAFDASTLSGLSTSFKGVVYVEATGGQPIMAIVNHTRYQYGYAAQMLGQNY